ncbi:MAG: two-component sensor histidine kinase [Candidatus Leucobacter sulfamidivorax]|nr:two-component sensor histidine kinase [Candidatus Leucobacter sulfamidivorax]
MTDALNAPVAEAAPGEPQPAEAELRLPRAPGVIRRWLAAHPRLVDWTIVGGYLFGCVLVIVVDIGLGFSAEALSEIDPAAAEYIVQRGAYLQWPWVIVSVTAVAVTAVALRLRRRLPLAGLIAICVVLLFEQGLLAAPASIALAFLLYAIPVYRGVAAGWLGFGIALVTSLITVQVTGGSGTGLIGPAGLMIAEGPFSTADRVGVNVLNALWLLAVLMVGINLGNRKRYVAALIDRAHQLAREREQRAQLAAAAERARIAREMHDIVAHSLSVVVTLSEAASVAIESQPVAAKQAVERAAETGRHALVEMRRLLGVLGDEAGGGSATAPQGLAPRAPQPGVAQLPELVAGFVDAGLRVTVTEQGVPLGDATQQLAVYRIVQEGLTNALRHAGPGAAVELLLEHGAERTRIEVVDGGPVSLASPRPPQGRGASAGTPIPGSGRGLAGAAERARMFGGELESGPRGAGWRVAAEVPLAGGAETTERDGDGR